jgi:CDP-4-dehydro-6-deoxyglucose reductase
VCKVRLIVGEVYYERPIAASVLTGTERAAGVCLSCRAVPITDIVIQLQEGDRLQGAGCAAATPPGAEEREGIQAKG